MTTEMMVYAESTASLRPHPDQAKIYGAIDGPHDADYGDLFVSVRDGGIHVPLIVSYGTPDLPDGTIISGHRRHAAAVELEIPDVPVIRKTYPSATHARLAHVDCNRAREKDEWVRTQEASALYDIQATLAAERKRAGQIEGGKARHQLAGTGTGKQEHADTRDAVAAKLGESGKTVDLRVKLADAAIAQNPEHPEQSPIAEALKSGKAVKTVAREQGVIAPASPKASTKGVVKPEAIVETSAPPPGAGAVPAPTLMARMPDATLVGKAVNAFLCFELPDEETALALEALVTRLPTHLAARHRTYVNKIFGAAA